MAAFGVGAADTRHALEIVPTRREPLAELLDALKAVPSVGVGVFLIVVLAEVGEVAVEDSMELRPRGTSGCAVVGTETALLT